MAPEQVADLASASTGRARQSRQGRSFHRQAEAVVIKIAITAVSYDAIRLTLPQ
jgi:hypothetical protein